MSPSPSDLVGGASDLAVGGLLLLLLLRCSRGEHSPPPAAAAAYDAPSHYAAARAMAMAIASSTPRITRGLLCALICASSPLPLELPVSSPGP
jgi:hypothetical protein